jgi:hypothetical protein
MAVAPLIVNLAEIDEADGFAKVHGWDGQGGSTDFLTKYFKKLPDPHRFGFLIELCIATTALSDEGRKDWAKALGVDLKPVRKTMEEWFAKEDSEAEQKSAPAEGKAPKITKGKK